MEAKRKSEQRKAPSTVTEEEEEQRAEALGTAHAKRRDLVCSMVNKELCDWSDAAWDSLERAYRVFLKKHKFL